MYYSCLLFVALFGVAGRSWEVTAGGELDGIIEKEERVLVACESLTLRDGYILEETFT
jgi:hypothetical protein